MLIIGLGCLVGFIVFQMMITHLCFSYWQKTVSSDRVPWYVNVFFWGDNNFRQVVEQGKLREFVELMHARLKEKAR